MSQEELDESQLDSQQLDFDGSQMGSQIGSQSQMGSQGSQSKKRLCDPSQSQEDRKKLRQHFRQLQRTTQDQREKLYDVGSSTFDELQTRHEQLAQKVLHTSEADLDNRLLRDMAAVGRAQASSLFSVGRKISASAFIDGCCSRYEAKEKDGFDWARLIQHSSKLWRTAPTTSFLNGALDIEPKVRKERTKPRSKKDVGEAVAPERVLDAKSEEKTQTDMRVKDMLAVLPTKEDHVSLLKFVANPESFTQTIENIFDLSFLIKEARAGIEVEQGVPFITKKANPSVNQLQNRTNNQCIVKFDFDMYKELCEKLELQQSYLPTRPVRF